MKTKIKIIISKYEHEHDTTLKILMSKNLLNKLLSPWSNKKNIIPNYCK